MERYIGFHTRVQGTQGNRKQKAIYIYSLGRPPNMSGK